MNKTVSAETLLQGAWYALEQSGRLLTSAALLYDHGDKSTAVVLSMLGREELGRSTILRKLAEQVAAGQPVTPEDVRVACVDHLEKQAAGAFSVPLRPQSSSQLDAALRTRMKASPGTEEWQRASETLNEATDRKRKRLSQDRHEMRERALYVDLDGNATKWLRPSAFDSGRALDEITDAVNDYATERDRLRDEVLDEDFPEMATARANMEQKIILPEPRWPKFLNGGAG